MPRRRVVLAVVPAGLLLLALCLAPATFSAFSSGTDNGNSTFNAGSVSLGDDDAGAAMFTVNSLQPGSTGSRCIAVTYTGSLPAQVRMYVSAGDLTGTLAPYLTLTVTEGAGGGFGSCSGFSAASTAWTGTLDHLASTATGWASGVGSFTPTANGQVRVYRVVYTLTAGSAAAGRSSQVRLSWEARNT
ncbi:hypothetical protein [Kineosporia sp. NBRC 101731]|uniref:hypothetical protein n=1 Tax=Kineosporia sp. NBRC 101731 TaxID=3032199 RepID=UPI0024A3C6B6|nr:hypothetical protein [Kineosporia sp. NBRC 101731]GLY28237.1 hypothetical protein Kisp02_16020 [Kineosporia sp. NBRC 101731]